MISYKSVWSDKTGRHRQLEKSVTKQQTAMFGSEVLHEKDKAQRVQHHFNIVSSKYDLMNTILSMGIHYAWKKSSVKALALKPPDRLLDLCAGTGDLSSMAGKIIGNAGQIVACDFNWQMLKTGIKKKRCRPFSKNTNFIQGDAESLPFSDEQFDAVIIGFGIRNLTHLEQGFREIFRVLKPEGRMVCLEFSKPKTFWFRLFYDFYSYKIMPLLGALITGSKDAYTVFPESIRIFPLPDEIVSILSEIGFKNISYKRLTDGIAVRHKAFK
ncbi:MAG: bifunctional demethylmenaquinone methyltransferase/2-methoxy-6-polyprenyl-1,4-benzoquinol methylase UbiE [Desulfobacterales bacterium]|nr:bifunctional demethylmenaquinone methyltransferase/2-methoxy-6-polyprenyl-1,4-benzoquinol methylase UbiE [Desulfobacterales bacterium]